MSKQQLKKKTLIMLLNLAEQSSREKSKKIELLEIEIKKMNDELFQLKKKDMRVSSLKYDLKKCMEEKRKLAKAYGYKIGVFRKKAQK